MGGNPKAPNVPVVTKKSVEFIVVVLRATKLCFALKSCCLDVVTATP